MHKVILKRVLDRIGITDKEFPKKSEVVTFIQRNNPSSYAGGFRLEGDASHTINIWVEDKGTQYESMSMLSTFRIDGSFPTKKEFEDYKEFVKNIPDEYKGLTCAVTEINGSYEGIFSTVQCSKWNFSTVYQTDKEIISDTISEVLESSAKIGRDVIWKELY